MVSSGRVIVTVGLYTGMQQQTQMLGEALRGVALSANLVPLGTRSQELLGSFRPSADTDYARKREEYIGQVGYILEFGVPWEMALVLGDAITVAGDSGRLLRLMGGANRQLTVIWLQDPWTRTQPSAQQAFQAEVVPQLVGLNESGVVMPVKVDPRNPMVTHQKVRGVLSLL
jgi:hypothetical protein